MDILQSIQTNLLTPPLLFFVLGVVASTLKSDLAIPKEVAKGLSLYLLIAIGFEGGTKLALSGFTPQVFSALSAGVLLSLLFPVLAFFVLRRMVDPLNAAAIAAHYGSVSAVTFVTCTALLAQAGVEYEPFLVALMAVMESPAILSGLILARLFASPKRVAVTQELNTQPLGIVWSASSLLTPQANRTAHPSLLREVLLNGSVVLLTGSILIGYFSGEAGMEAVRPVLSDPFQGLLAIFLLEMGLTAGRGFSEFRGVGLPLALFGLLMPLVGGVIGAVTGTAIGLSVGGATLLAVLAGSASYIAVPAAMRMALPDAKPSLSITLALGITFPFNVMIGIPIHLQIATWAQAYL